MDYFKVDDKFKTKRGYLKDDLICSLFNPEQDISNNFSYEEIASIPERPAKRSKR